jgi:hypothetical protein
MAPSGGDRRSGRLEAQRDYLLGLIRRTPDIKLLEIQERLIQNCAFRFPCSGASSTAIGGAIAGVFQLEQH